MSLPIPSPTATQVRIKVQAASINPDGKMKAIQKEAFPVIIGYDASGVVDAVGASVTKFKVGDVVFARTTVSTSGTCAEFCVSEEATVAMKPTTMSVNDAAAIPLAAMTALQMLRKGNMQAGDKVFINAGAGGVGHFAVQIAKAMGAACVVASASAPKHTFLKSIGADEVVDYKNENYTDFE